MPTAQHIIDAALRLSGGLTHEETPSEAESDACLEVLNSLIDQWRTKRRLVYVIDNKQFPLESGKQTYSMGPGGDWDTERPVKIQRAGVVYYKTDENDLLEGLRKPLEMIDSVRWAEIREKPMTAFEPLEVYNDNEYLAGCTYLSLWPIPICP